ncbi:hypothetical protein [Gryllotalpicola protaetiae]|uniref:Tetratricopeptide repeat protein n=1 Tax=Gryllotalpicola protaetiae TaxID=2419771 RepID=A0A387BVS5_9MICO|nr:hypothetical protein [Gryllotalpicola protaetiae]AYG02481.1 hypothetical protein D7I44_02360 [Gryllotalpicola protaetiae]
MAPLQITQDMFDERMEGLVLSGASPDELRDRAATLYSWATDAEEYELGAGVTRAALLSSAAEDYMIVGDTDRGLAVALEAKAAAGPDEFEPHATLIQIHIDRGDIEAAKAVADEARKGVASDPIVAELIGDSFELAGELAQAERIYTIGLRAANLDDDGVWYERLLRDRHRVRRDQQKPLDGYDEEFEELTGE